MTKPDQTNKQKRSFLHEFLVLELLWLIRAPRWRLRSVYDLALEMHGLLDCAVMIQGQSCGSWCLFGDHPFRRQNRFSHKDIKLVARTDPHKAAVTRLTVEELIEVFGKDWRCIGQRCNARCMRRLER